MSDIYLTGTNMVPVKGEGFYLSPQEEAFLQRMLRHPESFPDEFWTAVYQKVALNGEVIPQSQVQGLSTLNVSAATTISSSDAITATSFAAASHDGPSLTGLRNGLYIVLFGYGADVAGNVIRMGISANGAAATDGDSLALGYTSGSGTVSASVSKAVNFTLTTDNNNSLSAQYRIQSAGSISVANRWMTAIRYGNA